MTLRTRFPSSRLVAWSLSCVEELLQWLIRNKYIRFVDEYLFILQAARLLILPGLVLDFDEVGNKASEQSP